MNGYWLGGTRRVLVHAICAAWLAMGLSALYGAEPAQAQGQPAQGSSSAGPLDPRTLGGLICFWDFQEEAGQPRRGQGPNAHALEERCGPIQRVDGGIWGPYSARIQHGQWLRIDRRVCPALDLHGPKAHYSILAWLKRLGDNQWQFIAGVWDEANAKRQYALFTSGTMKTNWHTWLRDPAEHQAHAYASAEGGGTPPNRICFSYATGATRLEKDRWYFVAATYDQRELRVYVDGQLDTLENCNPFPYADKSIFDGGATGADFTVGQRNIGGWPTYPEGAPKTRSGFDGVLGGLAVYDRALTADEIRRVQQSTAKPVP